jgi:hypothetical protein
MTCTVQPREIGDARQKSICIYLPTTNSRTLGRMVYEFVVGKGTKKERTSPSSRKRIRASCHSSQCNSPPYGYAEVEILKITRVRRSKKHSAKYLPIGFVRVFLHQPAHAVGCLPTTNSRNPGQN